MMQQIPAALHHASLYLPTGPGLADLVPCLQVRGILGTLVDVLATPSAEVQRAVSACLPPLMPAIQADKAFTQELVQKLLAQLLKDKSYGTR